MHSYLEWKHPLTVLSLGAALIQVLEHTSKIGQWQEGYRFAYKFYQVLLNIYKAGELSDSNISKREAEFIKTLKF